jgi:hypothetical protein
MSAFPAGWNIEYVRDVHRGRHGTDRFDRLRRYAERRWRLSRDLRHSHRWLGVLRKINRRAFPMPP